MELQYWTFAHLLRNRLSIESSDAQRSAPGDVEREQINSKITGWSCGLGSILRIKLHLMILDFLKFGPTRVPTEPLIHIHVKISIKARA